MGDIALLDGTPTYWERIPDIIQAHKMFRDSGLRIFFFFFLGGGGGGGGGAANTCSDSFKC